MKKFLLALFAVFLISPIFSEEADSKTISGFSQYKPTYVLFGDQKDQIKNQISFKYQLLERQGFYLGFTQQMFWNAYDSNNSSPMKELNFNPEIFWKQDINFATFRYVQLIPFEHKSNGAASGNTDRTWDRSGAMITNTFSFKYFEVNTWLKTFYLYNLGSNNQDIKNYLGFNEARIAISPHFDKNTFFDKEEISFKFYGGFNGLGGREYGIKFRTLLPHFQPYIYFQIWEGYGQSLVNYNVYETSYRAGLIFQ